MDKLRIVSLNARGLKNKLKRNFLFKYFKEQKFDVVCLQESHITKKEANIWEREWGGKLFYNEGTERSKGELILISKFFTGSAVLEKKTR